MLRGLLTTLWYPLQRDSGDMPAGGRVLLTGLRDGVADRAAERAVDQARAYVDLWRQTMLAPARRQGQITVKT